MYEKVHDWWRRHALRAADSSAVYPDIYFRRLNDDIEISWLARQPAYAPDGFSLTLGPGFALLPVHSVAKAIWDFLEWATSSASPKNEADQRIIEELRYRFIRLNNTPIVELERCYIGAKLQSQLESVRVSVNLHNDGIVSENLPAIECLDSAVLMYGGLHVDIGQADARCLLGFIADRKGKSETNELASLARSPQPEVWSRPYEEGYALALECREELGIAADCLFIDVDSILKNLDVSVRHEKLMTDAIRGVAVAGNGFGPGIMVNTSSYFNNNEPGRRFTLLHEFCHILYDRTRAKKLSHVSGPWTSSRTEKRANAFAAMFMAPPSAIRDRLANNNPEAIRILAADVGMGVIALIEHIYNIDLINDAEREHYRQYFGRQDLTG